MTKAAADAWLREGGPVRDELKRLPEDVDAELAAKRVLSMLGEGHHPAWTFGRYCQHVPLTVIREVLAQLPQQPVSAERLFLREFIGAVPSIDSWVEALQALLDLGITYAWGSKQRKAKLRALAKNPRVVSAIQAAVVGAADASLDMLAVLAIDSSEASIDALLPKFVDSNRQARLEKLATHAAESPAMTALLESATRRREEKERTSTAVEVIGRIVGDPKLNRVKFTFAFSSEESETGVVPVVQAHLSVDSAHDGWWSVSVTRVDRGMRMPTTWFSAEQSKGDALGLGTCSFEELPQWIAKAARKLKVTFRVGYFSGSLRGKKRDAMMAWLLSGR